MQTKYLLHPSGSCVLLVTGLDRIRGKNFKDLKPEKFIRFVRRIGMRESVPKRAGLTSVSLGSKKKENLQKFQKMLNNNNFRDHVDNELES